MAAEPRRLASALACLALIAAAVIASTGQAAPAPHLRRGHGRAGSSLYLANARLESAAVSHPRSYLATGGLRISGIRWKRYGGKMASGTGKVGHYRAALKASRVKKIDGRRFYTRLLLVYQGKHPRGKPRQRLNVEPLPLGAAAMSKLAKGLAGANSQGEREAVLRSILQALGIGIYTGDGAQVQAGFETGPNGIYLYEFEVQALAAQLGRGELASFDQLASALDAAGFELSAGAPTGMSLEAATVAGIAALHGAASTPEAALGLVVRDLGLARGVDLAKPQSPSAPILDQAQLLLLTIDLARGEAGGAGASGLEGAAPRVRAQASQARASDQCSNPGGGFYGAASTGSIGASIILGKGITPRAILTKEILDGIHGVALGYSFQFRALKDLVSGAFGSNGPGSATAMQFQVQAELLDNAADAHVDCGALKGQNPEVGGIPVSWNFESVGHLEYLGTVHCDADCTTTDSSGIATMIFRPDDEYLPGVGSEFIEHGTVTANAHPQEAKGNILGAVAEALGFTKEAPIGWEVSFHDPSGYRVEIPPIHLVWNFPDAKGQETSTSTYTNMETCSISPELPHPTTPPPTLGYSIPASSEHSELNSHVAIEEEGESSSFDTTTPGVALPISFAGDEFANELPAAPAVIGGQWVFDQPTVHARIIVKEGVTVGLPTGVLGTISPGEQTIEAPVTEAKGCPPALGR